LIRLIDEKFLSTSYHIDTIYKCTKSKLRVRDLERKSDVRGNQGQIKLQVVVDSKLKSQRPRLANLELFAEHEVMSDLGLRKSYR
jgi:hypothetical protein